MTKVTMLLAMAAAGGLVGLFYLGGLWLTLNKMKESSRWSLWLGASFLLRSTIAVAAFWFFAGGDWQRILALLTGFTIVRFLSVKTIQHK